MESLFGAFTALLENSPDNDEIREAFVFAAWRRCAGEMLSEHTVPTKLTDSRLTVAVSSNMWKRHLEDMAPQILFKLNETLGSASVKFVEFFIDEEIVLLNRRVDAKNAKTDPAKSKEITPELRQAAAAIGDEHLRQQFLLAADSCLARKRRNSAAERI